MRARAAFALAGGPLAWLVQLAFGYALAARSCYAGPDRLVLGPGSWWTLILLLACLAIALAGGAVAAGLRRAADRALRFLAGWGMLLGFGFAGLILLNAIALAGVPPCAL